MEICRFFAKVKLYLLSIMIFEKASALLAFVSF